MDTFTTITTILGGATAIITAGIAYGSLKNSVDKITETLKDDIKPYMKEIDRKVNDLNERTARVEEKISSMDVRLINVENQMIDVLGRLTILWQDKVAPTHSPRQLNELGLRILKESGIKEIIEEKQNELFEEISRQKPNNAYDAEQLVIDTVMKLTEKYPETENTLKNGAFRMGQHIDDLLFVGGIYLRDLIFSDLGFSLTNLDLKNNESKSDPNDQTSKTQ